MYRYLRNIFTIFIIISIIGCDNSAAERKTAVLDKKDDVIKGKDKVKTSNEVFAPDFTLADLEGNKISLNQLKGKVILLNFWGTWCGPCRKEIPDFIKLVDKYKDDGLEIVGITLTSGPPKNIDAFAKNWGINYTLLTDIEGNETQVVTSIYGRAIGRPITGIPTTFLIDRDGIIRKKYVGPRSEEIFYNDLEPYL
tara:strand:+ start:239 stop:826 length:588 start_codon:yes stop_codon:yes gene_type:complete